AWAEKSPNGRRTPPFTPSQTDPGVMAAGALGGAAARVVSRVVTGGTGAYGSNTGAVGAGVCASRVSAGSPAAPVLAPHVAWAMAGISASDAGESSLLVFMTLIVEV